MEFNTYKAQYESAADKKDYFILFKAVPIPNLNKVLPHYHKSLEIMVVLEGKSSIMVNGTVYNYSAGDIFVLNPYDTHSYLNTHENQHYILLFGGSYLSDFSKQFNNKIFNNFLDDKEFNSKIIELSNQFYNNPQKNDYLVTMGFINIILGMLTSRYELISKTDSNNFIVSKMIGFIEENYTEDISLDDMAKQVGYSKNYCSSMFNKFTGVDFRSYLSMIRVEKAKEMLDNPSNNNKKIIDIITSSGFNSPVTFYRAYKKSYGTLPQRN